MPQPPDPTRASESGESSVEQSLSLAVDLIDLLTAPAEELPGALQARLQRHLPAGCYLLPERSAEQQLTPQTRLTPLAVEAGDWRLLTPASFDEAAALAGWCGSVLQRFWRVRRMQDELRRQAFTDELTGLANARRFHTFLEEKVVWSKQTGWPVTLLLFDIDNFRQYNEQYGHVAGDRILKQTAELLRKCSRVDDLVARLSGGGDEFAMVFWDKGGPRHPREPASTPILASPLQVFERFKKQLASAKFPDLGPGGLGRLTISAGMAVCPADACDAAQLIAKADEALMFGAKRSGKNRLHIVGSEA